MSWEQYNDMWKKSQKDGKYHLFCFDLKGSKNIKKYFCADIKLLLYRVYFKIMDKEKELNKLILHKSKLFNDGFRGDLFEPFFISGDFFGFTILRGSMTSKDVYNIVKITKEELNFQYLMHYADGYYETDDYNERIDLYFRGYCMCYLNNNMKKKKKTI